MYNKLNPSYNKRRLQNFEDEPPDKKLISEGDLFIKQLSVKQRNTNINLEEQLSHRNQFYKSTELVSLTNYASGCSSVEEFNSIINHSNNVELLKSYGLSNDEIDLFCDFKKGEKHMQNKHKNMNNVILKEHINNILHKIKSNNVEQKNNSVKQNRLKTEEILAIKPTSIETKLLKFAFENKQSKKEQVKGPMDQIKDIEVDLMKDLETVDIRKIRKKARSLAQQVDSIKTDLVVTIKDIKKEKDKKNIFTTISKWDVKDTGAEDCNKAPSEEKVYTCRPQNYYTIKDGQIVKLSSTADNSCTVPSKPENRDNLKKISLEEIKQMPKFRNYEKGEPSKVLYLKNLSHGVRESDLENIFQQFREEIVSVKVMSGKMQGQAFVELKDEESAGRLLNYCNGIILKSRPVIIQYGRRKSP